MYYCSMHPEVVSDMPGHCPICGMHLIIKRGESVEHTTNQSYRPLFIIVGLIAVVTIILTLHQWLAGAITWHTPTRLFMAGFFLVFAGFKLLDVSGFAQGYATYDLLAKRWIGYGFLYPFLELTLGLSYAINLWPTLTNGIALLLMAFSGMGVAITLKRHAPFQCACLGTLLKVPLTIITLVEDFGMAIMALLTLLTL